MDAAELVAVSNLIREGWVNNGAVRLHYIESGSDTSFAKTPVVYLSGGTAEGFLPEMKALAPRTCVSLSLRGRGKSSSPETGYSFDHNVSDIETVISKLDLKNFCVMGWSIGVTYSIAYVSRNPGTVSGLVLLDYAARHPKWSHGWAERVSSDPSIGKDPNRMRGLDGLERESADVVLWDSLDRIKCPVLIIGGGQADALLKPEHIEKYRQHLPGAEIVVFEDSGHNVSQPNYERFIGTVKSFLNRLDGMEKRDISLLFSFKQR